MRVFENIEPKNVFGYFEDICGIPHGSGNTQQISDYCVEFAKMHHLKYRQEPCGNVVIWKNASPGYENAAPVMLQGHLDMVAVKTEDCDLDLETEGLRPAVTEDGQWVYAKGTSLGGDDGIAVAYALAILADDTLAHPALEVVFTVDEEIGLLGATALQTGDLKSRILLNMDSEDDGIFLTSCAGGATMECLLTASYGRERGIAFAWKVNGLKGGHSGTEIHLGRANANVVFGRFLAQTGEKVSFSVADFAGGEKDNAIADKCRAILVAAPEEAQKLQDAVYEFEQVLKAEYGTIEPGLSVTLTKLDEGEYTVLTKKTQSDLTALLEQLPTGVQRMMPDMPEMVQTSLNPGILKLTDTEISITFSVRSASGTEKEWLLKRIEDLTKLIGGNCRLSGVYPAWEYNPDSGLQKLMTEIYEEISGEKAVLTGIHAGVECGIFCEKMPGIDCISYGPQMLDIHTVREKLNIASVKKNYELTLKVLEKLN